MDKKLIAHDVGANRPSYAAGTVFVAMAFKEDLAEVYEKGIKVAIERTGLVPIRIDKETFSEKICERILTEIHRAEFVLADFTHHRGGVYFEAGYALALGKKVIWCCRKDQMDEVHFDTRQYPHIVWPTVDSLTTQLEEKLHYLKEIKNSGAGPARPVMPGGALLSRRRVIGRHD